MIKFRVWDSQKFRYDIYIKDNKAYEIYYTEGLLPGRMGLHEIPNCIINQYIGKTDIHGKEIYEGDIVECYKWFDGLDSHPKQKSRYTVTAQLDSILDEHWEGGYDGCDRVKEIEIVGHIYK